MKDIEVSHNAVQLFEYLQGKDKDEQIRIISLCISMAYDKGACSIIKMIALKGLVSNVRSMESLNELGSDLTDDINRQIEDLVEITND